MKHFLGLGLLTFLTLSGSAAKSSREILWRNGSFELREGQVPMGKKGFAIMRLRPEDVQNLPEGAREIPEGDNRQRSFLVPVNDLHELDAMAIRSHDSTKICGSFDFIPANYRLADKVLHEPPVFPAEAEFSEIGPLLEKVQLANIDAHLDSFVGALPSRYHKNAEGVNAGQKLLELWSAIDANHHFTISKFSHSGTQQQSVVARLEGDSPETIVIGAHLDSIASRSDNGSVVAPGADDDASGIAVLSELLRVISTDKLNFHKSIELHGYAAEEVGLIGSREIAVNYANSAKTVSAMMQIDMTYFSFPGNEGTMYFLEDFSALDLRRNAISWVKRYIGDHYKRGVLPRGSSSDHKSWYDKGVATLFAFEDPEFDNSHIHSIDDTRAQFDDGLLTLRIARLGMLFLTHQAGWKDLDTSFNEQKAGLAKPDVPKDIYVALSGSTSAARFSVSAPLKTEYLEFCKIKEAEDLNCVETRQYLSAQGNSDSRRLFSLEESFSFAAGERWRIYAYDASDNLIARRQFEWTTP